MASMERASRMSNVLIYTKDNCPYCVRAKSLLRAKGHTYSESKIGVDITTEDFRTIFPDVRTVPYIIINGDKIGGFNELTEWYNSNGQRQFLGE
jgi:glutaredoxin 3